MMDGFWMVYTEARLEKIEDLFALVVMNVPEADIL